ncbi:MAG: AbrB family transcriptional regulator [Alphaproteobacteria bacterium]|nr:AbrB family transcriptional regulator [Alphaproteobacteria bacterium]
MPILTALAIGTLGGALFDWLRLPLPWMLGAMAATTAASIAGVPQRVPGKLRQTMVVVIAVMLGSAFTPDVLPRLEAWAISLIGVIVYVVAATLLVLILFRKSFGHDPLTSLLCATPGGLGEMVVLAQANGADDRLVALSHSTRVFIVVMVLPFWFRFVEGYVPPVQSVPGLGLFAFDPAEFALLAACGVAGYFAATWLKLPAAPLIGPLGLSAIVHLTGLSSHRPPWEIVALAQVVMGSAVGARFAGVPFAEVRRMAVAGSASAAILLSLTVVFAWVLHHLTGLSMQSLVLSFAPGGLAEMSLVALALDIDTAFVSTHHATRMISVVLTMPFLIQWLMRRRGTKV